MFKRMMRALFPLKRMQYTPMQYVYALCKEENSSILLWWTPGAHFYLYQTIDHADSSARVYSAVNVDPMWGNDLSRVAKESWLGYEVMEYSTDYSG